MHYPWTRLRRTFIRSIEKILSASFLPRPVTQAEGAWMKAVIIFIPVLKSQHPLSDVDEVRAVGFAISTNQ